jgi:hypothetical protein
MSTLTTKVVRFGNTFVVRKRCVNVTPVGESVAGRSFVDCTAHARRKFFELHVANKSLIAEYALGLIGQRYKIEREAKASSQKYS